MTDKNGQMEDRIADLEARFAFQSEAMESLSDMVSEQWKEIDRLKKQLKTLDDQMYDLEQNAGPAPVQKPPHY